MCGGSRLLGAGVLLYVVVVYCVFVLFFVVFVVFLVFFFFFQAEDGIRDRFT